MDILEIVRLNLLSPMVLAFVLGIIAVIVGSDLEIPDQIYTIITVYLLLAIGLKGGFDLAKSDLADFIAPAIVTVILGAAMPVWSFFILNRMGSYDVTNAAALAIHYGGVSAVTLSAAVAFLGDLGEPFEGFMPTMYAIMEIPAVIVGLWLAGRQAGADRRSAGNQLKAALTGKSFLLLGGGVIVGYLSGEAGSKAVAPFFVDLFPGVLTLFLLEMGMLVGRRLSDVRKAGMFLIAFGIIMPMIHAVLGILLGQMAGLSVGGSMILGTLAASASYITAPAVVRASLPDANPGYYLTAALVITFPFNLIVGLPLYFEVAKAIAG